MNDRFTLEWFARIGVSLLVLCLFSLASLWATNRRVGWTLRLAPIATLLAALPVVGAVTPAIVFAIQALFVVACMAGVRALGRWRHLRAGTQPDDAAQWERQLPSFSIGKLFKAVALAAVVLAIVSYAPAEAWSDFNWEYFQVWMQVLAMGVGQGLLTLAALALVVWPSGWRLMLLGLALLLPAGSIHALSPWWWIADDWVDSWGLAFLLALANCLLLVGWLWLIALTGWAWWRQPDETDPQSSGSDIADVPARISTTQLVARWTLGLFALPCLVVLADLYWALLPPRHVPVVQLPSPNGYDELVRIGDQLNWNAIPGDPDTAPAAQCRQFEIDNEGVLQSLSQALARPAQVPRGNALKNTSSYQAFRNLARAQAVRARAAEDAGRPADGVRHLLDSLQISNRAARGGATTDMLVMSACEDHAAGFLLPLLRQADENVLAAAAEELVQLRDARDPLSDTLQRDRLIYQIEYGWAGRLYLWWRDRGIGGFDVEGLLPELRNQDNARYNLLLAEIGIRRYQLANGHPPDQLADLVPNYLPEMPLDPFDQQPLRYRRTDSGYLVYSVGRNGVDDGGVAGADRTEGDFLLETKP